MSETIFENCVCCGKKTKYPVTLPIQSREFYMSGAGQLCEACFHMLRGNSDTDRISSDNEMRILLQTTPESK